jgi:hypothetical protein
MKTNPLKDGALIENSAGLGTVTRKMVRERAVELAVINGRSAQDVSKSDWEQAKRELTGEPDTDPKIAALESVPESERWNPVPGSAGRKAPVAPSADETTRGVVTMRNWLKKALPERNMIKCGRPPAKAKIDK